MKKKRVADGNTKEFGFSFTTLVTCKFLSKILSERGKNEAFQTDGHYENWR